MKLIHLALLLTTIYLHNVLADDFDNEIGMGDESYARRGHHSTEFDLLIFTQQWPITECYKYQEGKPENTCNIPSPEQSWTIHGVWPTKLGTVGPSFCDKSAHFDLNQLQPIRPELEQFWPNVQKNHPVDSLWSHEWLKHGTCAAMAIPEMNNELKYFGKGLDLLKQYSMNKVLGDAGIVPGGNYGLQQIHDVLSEHFKTNIAIECFHDKHTKQQFIIEIRSCFDKSLNPTDCDGIKSRFGYLSDDTIITNCARQQPIVYPGKVPSFRRGGEQVEDLPNDLSHDNDKQGKLKRKTKLIVRVVDLLKWVVL
ncbi:ribonuclease Oy isoform X2 [Uranotaenia lowii]|uniref:ribonuclease Oy isoform X2 n=1 Tax=Uranotaenia lowii TaxID=190385 RepID=UPI00247AE959|nr:ribonuclease Oy isoform X2 [Uranotaenia lowii]